jgi:hypothetical protein
VSSEWADIIVFASLTLGGLYFTWNYRRQLQVSLATRRLAVYVVLWERTCVAAPTPARAAGIGEEEDP